MSAIFVGGVRYPLGDAEARLDARLALRDAGIDRAPLSPPDGREFGVDGLFSYEGILDASALERELLEQYRLRHMHEKAPEFSGYSHIPARYVLRSLVERYDRPQSPFEVTEAVIDGALSATREQARIALDEVALDRELDGWAARPAARVAVCRSL